MQPFVPFSLRVRLIAALGACAIALGCGSSSGDSDDDEGTRGGSPTDGTGSGGGGGGGTGGGGTGGGGTGGGGTGGGGTGGGGATGTPATEAEIADFARTFAPACEQLCAKDRDCNPYDYSAEELAEEYEDCMDSCSPDDDGELGLLEGFGITRECLAAYPGAVACVSSLSCPQLRELYSWEDEDEDDMSLPPYCQTEYTAVMESCQFDFDFDFDEDWEWDGDDDDWEWDGDDDDWRGDRFDCGDGSSIPGDWVCDGDDDCADASDEADC
jgi:hypothetical protein